MNELVTNKPGDKHYLNMDIILFKICESTEDEW